MTTSTDQGAERAVGIDIGGTNLRIAVVERHGRLDVLICNSGVMTRPVGDPFGDDLAVVVDVRPPVELDVGDREPDRAARAHATDAGDAVDG